MPKIVDHEQRRAAIAEALWRVVATGGIEAVTIRSVAAATPWSRGVVEHYFTNKEELLAYACAQASQQALAQTKLRRKSLRGREALRAVLCDCANQDDVWFELISLAAREPALRAQLASFDAQISVLIAEIIAEMVARGEAASDLDPAVEARSVFAFNVGLKVNCRMQPQAARKEIIETRIEEFLDHLQR